MNSLLKSFKNIISILGKYKKPFRMGYVFSIIEQTLAFVPYFTLFYIIKIGLERAFRLEDFYLILSIMIMSLILRIVFKRIQDSLQQDKGYYALSKARLAIAKHLENLNMGYYTEGNIGNITSIVTSDIVFVEEFGIFQMGIAISSIISIIFSIAFLFVFDYRIGLLYLVLSLVSIFALNELLKKQKAFSRERQDNLAHLSNALLSFVKGMPVIKAFNMKKEQNTEIDEKIDNTRNAALKMVDNMQIYLLSFELFTSLSSAIMMIFIAYLTLKHDFNIAYGIGFIIFSFNVFLPISLLGLSSEMLSVASAGIDRYRDLMRERELEDKSNSPLKAEKMDINFKDVSFAYEKKEVLQNVNLTIKDKTFTALVGKSGSGKTTIVNLLARFWDIKKGEILIDGINIKDMSFEALLSDISMVFQSVYLFNDTIYNNIAFGSTDASRDDVISAAKKARCHDFIMSLENGYDTIIAESGSTLSGGERQRISIARAILKDAKLILLDEATVGIDPENEKFIQQAIDELVKDKTLIVIAHKLSTIKNADNIVYLENGKIIEQGTHQQLLERGGKYKNQFDFYIKNYEQAKTLI